MIEKNLRNKRIFNLFTYSKTKKSLLAKQFNLSITRITQIIEKQKAINARIEKQVNARIELHRYSEMMKAYRSWII